MPVSQLPTQAPAPRAEGAEEVWRDPPELARKVATVDAVRAALARAAAAR